MQDDSRKMLKRLRVGKAVKDKIERVPKDILAIKEDIMKDIIAT